MKKQQRPPTLSDYIEAFLEFLRRPKTVFDLKDRTKGIILLIAIIIMLQKVVQMLSD